MTSKLVVSFSELKRVATAETGGPLDIEWAVAQGKLYLLQSRPITTLPGHNPMIGEWNDSLLGNYFWSNVNIGEVYLQVLTPFTWSRVQEAYRELSPLPGYQKAGGAMLGMAASS